MWDVISWSSTIFTFSNSSPIIFFLHHRHHHLLLLPLISQGQKWRRPAAQLGLSELPKENHSAPFFLLHFLALSPLRGDTQSAICVCLCLSVFGRKSMADPFSIPLLSCSNYVSRTPDLAPAVCSIDENKMPCFPKRASVLFTSLVSGWCLLLSE